MGSSTGVLTGDPRRELRIVAGIIATVVALIHLFHPRLGVPRLIEYIEVGQLFHPLPPIFTASAIFIVFGIVLVYQGILIRLVYALGIVMMAGFVIGYMAWHTVLDHGAFWPTLEGAVHDQPNALVLLWLHMSEDPLGVVSKVLEIKLAAVLGMLLLIDRPASVTDGNDSGERDHKDTPVSDPKRNAERTDPGK